jgi:hypothetical protein
MLYERYARFIRNPKMQDGIGFEDELHKARERRDGENRP